MNACEPARIAPFIYTSGIDSSVYKVTPHGRYVLEPDPARATHQFRMWADGECKVIPVRFELFDPIAVNA